MTTATTTRWKWIYHNAERPDLRERLYDIGINADGTLHNPNGYPDADVRAAIAGAEERARQRRQEAAAKAAVTRRRRRERKVYEVAQRIATGGTYGPATACVICGRGLDDHQSIQRGIGSECWQFVLDLIEGTQP